MFLTKPQDVKIGINGMAKFECVASGNPQPSVFWTKEGSQELMFPDNSYDHCRVSSEGTLEINNVRKDDAGFYVCSAFSVAGSGTTRAFLQVSTFPTFRVYPCSHPSKNVSKSHRILMQLNPSQERGKPHV